MNDEFAFIQSIRERARQSRVPATELSVGIGDDAAVFRPRAGRELLLTTDLLVEDVDFKLEYAVPRWLGHKALAVSLSDIAAMGGAQCYAMLTLAVSRAMVRNPQSAKFWEEFFDGYFALAESCGVVLIGGDISATPQGLAIDSMVIGDCLTGHAVRRSGAQIGDLVFVTGHLGGATVGLQLLMRGAPINEREVTLKQRAMRAHLRPEARVEFGKLLGESGLAHAMIDISDGLAQDLAHLCRESRASVILEAAAVPIAEVALTSATNANEAFGWALNGGEDYELLLTASGAAEARLRHLAEICALPLTHIGEVVVPAPEAKVLLRTADKVQPLQQLGYDHFREARNLTTG